MARGIGAIRLGVAVAAIALVAVGVGVSGSPSNTPVPAGVKATAPPLMAAKPVRPAPVPQPVVADASPFVVKRILQLDGPLRTGDYHWDDKGVPAGPIVITVDLAAEVLSVFRGGYEIGTAAVLYGAPEKPSPLGAFPILEKDVDHVSSLYDAPMPYMLRLTRDGVAIHGSNVRWNYATHGCIGVPTPFAKLLFAQARIGDRVLITRGKTLQMGEAITKG